MPTSIELGGTGTPTLNPGRKTESLTTSKQLGIVWQSSGNCHTPPKQGECRKTFVPGAVPGWCLAYSGDGHRTHGVDP